MSLVLKTFLIFPYEEEKAKNILDYLNGNKKYC